MTTKEDCKFETCHIPVMEREVVEYLRAARGGRFLDCTLGGGGHTRAILQVHEQNKVVAVDRDRRAIIRAQSLVDRYSSRLTVLHLAFAELRTSLELRSFDGIVADLGVSTDQLTEERGFSFGDDASLDMRMDESSGVTARELINKAEESELFRLLKRGGVGKEARAVSRAITRGRPFDSAKMLAGVVNRALQGASVAKKRNPSTVVFQAIRIAVNREFDQLESLLDLAPDLARPGSRLAIITFHSLEDRAVARRMRDWQGGSALPAMWSGARPVRTLGTLVSRKAICPSADEEGKNRNSRSARMRVFEFDLGGDDDDLP